MNRFYVNNIPESDGLNEVHFEDCIMMNFVRLKTDLGLHKDCYSALKEAEKYFEYVKICNVCLKDC